MSEEEKVKPVSTGNDLLAAIRGGASLKKVEREEKKEEAKGDLGMFGSEEVAAMLARRKFLELESDSDDSDDDWD